MSPTPSTGTSSNRIKKCWSNSLSLRLRLQLAVYTPHQQSTDHKSGHRYVSQDIIVHQQSLATPRDNEPTHGGSDTAAQLLHRRIDAHKCAAVLTVGNGGDQGLTGYHPRKYRRIQEGIEQE